MKHFAASIIAAAIVFALVGCNNPASSFDSETDSGPAYTSEKLTVDDGTFNQYLGYSLSVSGDTAILGAYGHNVNGGWSGGAYIFTLSDGSWSQTDFLSASDGATNDYFGYSVSISGDIAVVGARVNDDNGSAYIFTRSGGTWSQTAKLTAGDGAAYDYFGSSVSISGDTAVIGSYGNNTAYIFTLSNGTWNQTVILKSNDAASGDRFGVSVSITDDTVLIGAYMNDDDGTDSGSAYIFTRSGGTWTQKTKLTAGDGAAGDYFGYSVSISGDTAIVGAYQDDDGGTSSGSAYIFTLSGGTWTQTAKLTAADGAESDSFGYSVSISGDTAVIGAYGDDDDGTSSGSAYIYELSGGAWTQNDKLTADDAAAGDYFGYKVSVSEDRILVGAYQEDDGGSDSGAAYVFEND